MNYLVLTLCQTSNRAFPQPIPPKLPLPRLGLSPAPFAAAVPSPPFPPVCPPPAAPRLPPSRLIAAWLPRFVQRGRRVRALVARACIHFLGPRPLPAAAAPQPLPAMQSVSVQEVVVLVVLAAVGLDQVATQAAGAVGARRSRAPV